MGALPPPKLLVFSLDIPSLRVFLYPFPAFSWKIAAYGDLMYNCLRNSISTENARPA